MPDNDALLTKLREATASLSGISEKKMFGCDTILAEGVMFAMVWKEGNIAVKLPDPTRYAEVAAMRGVAPWMPGGKRMSAWLLLPTSIAKNPERLADLVVTAHGCRKSGKKPKNQGGAVSSSSRPRSVKGRK